MISKYNEIQKYLQNNFNHFKNEVTKEIIYYYKEKYRDIIMSRLEETEFIFYISPKFSDFLRYSSKKNSNYKLLKKDYKVIQKEVRKNKLNSGVICNTMSYIPNDYEFVSNNNFICFRYTFDKDSEKLTRKVFIPIFYADDRAIVHEMVHSIMSSPLLLYEKDEFKYKFGIGIVDNADEALMEECMTEIDARRIARRLKEKKISFIDKYYLFEGFLCSYDYFIPSVNNLYNLYEDEINESRITLNSRKFIYSIGKENYYDFVKYLYDFYNYLYDVDRSYYKEHLQKCISNIEKHKNSNQLKLSKN